MKKGQAAMEFLMTYGWAILVVLGAIAALAYFGVLDPSRVLPERCVLDPGLDCTGFKVTSDGYALVLRNGMGKHIYVTNVSMMGCSYDGLNESFENADTLSIVKTGCNFSTAGTRADGEVRIEYIEKTTGLDKVNSGTITTKVSVDEEIVEEGGGEEEEEELTPVALTATTAESYQDEGTRSHTVTSKVSAVDDDWAPVMTGSVNKPYYATGSSNKYWDALALRFSTSSYNSSLYSATLRFYLKDGPYSGGWHHYKIYDDYKATGCQDSSPGSCSGTSSYSNGFEGWIEVSIADDVWDDGELSLRLWDAYIDKVELYLEPQE